MPQPAFATWWPSEQLGGEVDHGVLEPRGIAADTACTRSSGCRIARASTTSCQHWSPLGSFSAPVRLGGFAPFSSRTRLLSRKRTRFVHAPTVGACTNRLGLRWRGRTRAEEGQNHAGAVAAKSDAFQIREAPPRNGATLYITTIRYDTRAEALRSRREARRKAVLYKKLALHGHLNRNSARRLTFRTRRTCES